MLENKFRELRDEWFYKVFGHEDDLDKLQKQYDAQTEMIIKGDNKYPVAPDCEYDLRVT